MTLKMINVYWSKCNWRDQAFFIAATDYGLCYIGSPNAAFSELEQWICKKMPNHTLMEVPKKLSTACTQLRSYLDGKRANFSLPLDIIGTHFQKRVWQAMSEVDYGRTVTYSDIAHRIENKEAVRAVGTAIGANPLMIVLPCHRVIAKNGGLAGFRGGVEMKKRLLELEGAPTED